MNDIVTRSNAPADVKVKETIADAYEAARNYARSAYTENTHQTYQQGWTHFANWARRRDVYEFPVPVEVVVAYLADHAPQYSMATLEQRLASIVAQHRLYNQPFDRKDIRIRTTLRGIARNRTKSPRRAAALLTESVKKLIDACPDDLAGTRDRAMFLLFFTGALRRSEVVGLDVEHVTIEGDGMRLFFPRSKGDRDSKGEEIGVGRVKNKRYCPIAALEAWLRKSGLSYGPIFRKVNRWGTVERDRLSLSGVHRIVKARAAIAGVEAPNVREHVSPHSFRAGFVTQAYLNKAQEEDIKAHARHKSWETTRRYIRRTKTVKDTLTPNLGL